MTDLFFDEHVAGAQDFFVVPFGKYDLLGIGLGLVNHSARNFVGLAQAALQLNAIGLEVDRFLCDPAAHGGLGDGGRLPNQHPCIERLGNEILAAKLQAGHSIDAANGVGNVFLGKVGECVSGRQLHFFVDGGGAHVERSAKDEGESEHVVDLVGIVGAPGGDDHIGTGGLGFFVGNLGIGIRHGEDDRVGRHRANHVLIDRILYRESGEDVRADQRFGKSAQLCVLREALFVFVHAVFAALVDDAFGVAEKDVFALYAQTYIVLGAGDTRCPSAVKDHAHFANVFAHDFESIEQGRAGNDGGTVLVVVEDGNLHGLA